MYRAVGLARLAFYRSTMYRFLLSVVSRNPVYVTGTGTYVGRYVRHGSLPLLFWSRRRGGRSFWNDDVVPSNIQ